MPLDQISHPHGSWIVGVGASAGGLEALITFLSGFKNQFKGSIIIAQHLAPHAKSMMVELLAKNSPMPVVPVQDRHEIEPGKIYVIPPNHDAHISKNRITLTLAGPETRPKPSVDDFFISLAEDRGPQAIGVILSGTGSDGAEGIRAIRNHGGLTLAQSGHSAKYDGMPQAAIETDCVDAILDAQEMGKFINDSILNSHNWPQAPALAQDDLQKCLQVLKEKTGSDFSQYRPSTIRRRLQKRMVTLRMRNLAEYISHIEMNAGEAAALAQDLLVSVTAFFRDTDAFHDLRKEISEAIFNKKNSTEFRTWVAGCATGEEAYTIAMLLIDATQRLGKHMSIKVFATDLDSEALVEARNGFYKAREVEQIPPEFREKFFTQRDGDRYEVKKILRDTVLFARQDMIQNPPFVKLDLITCRNVMIYFELELQKRLLEIFHYALIPSGTLFLGKSESLGSAAHLFEAVDKKSKIYRRLNVPSSFHTSRVPSAQPFADYVPVKRRPDSSLLEKGLLRLIQDYSHAAIIVDRDTHILQTIGDVSHFVGLSSTQSDFRLLNLLPREVSLELPILIRKCVGNTQSHSSQWYRLKKTSRHFSFRMTARALTHDSSAPEYFLINFEERRDKTARVEEAPTVDTSNSQRMMELEQELFSTREHLQTVIQELGVANEELQALNEELSSTNEELQSTNEELETTNEELQSSNEELTTVNDELSSKSVELRDLNLKLENIQESIGAALVVVDNKRRILRYNEESLKIFSLTPADLGRDLAKVSAKFEMPDFTQKLQEAIRGHVSESLCEGTDEVYQMRALPLIDETNQIVGAILFFINNTEFIRTREKLEVSEQQIRSIIEGSADPITIKDHFGKYLIVNKAFSDFFGLPRDGVLGKSDRELFTDVIASSLRDADLEVMLTAKSVKREEVFHRNGKEYTLLVNRFPLFNQPGRPYAVGMISVDVTLQKRAQEELRESESRYKALIEDQAVLVCRQLPSGKLIYVNTVFAAQFGGRTESYSGHYFFEYLHTQDQSKAKADLQMISKTHQVTQSELRIYREDHSLRWVRWFHRGIFDAHDNLVEIQTVGFDVSDYRLQAEKFRDTEAVYSTIFGNTSDIITIMRRQKADFIIESMNDAGERLLSRRKGDLIGKSLRDIRKPDELQKLIGRYNQVLEENLIYTYEDQWHVEGVDFHFSNTVVPIPDENGRVERLAVLSKDVSSYKTIESALRSSKDAAEVANVAKSDFLASMSHELRTPLNVVLGMSHLLQETSLNEEQSSYLASIERSSKALLSLIEDILDITKIESGKINLSYQTFDLPQMVREAASMFQIQAEEKGVKLEVHISPEAERTVIGDAGRLRQVLVNLIGNAMKFTDKGRIEVRVTAPARDVDGEKRFRFEVQDSGIGIKKEHHHKIFQRFSQVESGHSRRFGGSGLGLVISRQISQLMKGDMGFSSEEGKGSTFWVEAILQLSTKSEAQADRERKEFIMQPLENEVKGLNILAVDDNKENLNIISLFLKRLQHKIVTCTSGSEALKLAQQEKFDIILMDVQMPEMDGYETTRRLRALESEDDHRVIIALTANAMAGDAQRCKDAGMNDYLSKPIRIEILKQVLARWSLMTKKG